MTAAPTIVIASGNAGKVREIRQALASLNINLPSLADLNLTQSPEPHISFMENALAKARAAADAVGGAALADDSGIVVPALNGAPGVHSARYAGNDSDDQQNNQKLLLAMRDVQERGAFYYAAMVYVSHATDPAPIFAEGFWRGEILQECRGDGGFGYDPIFYDSVVQKTGAQMQADEKNAVSHRGQSLKQLLQLMQKRGVIIAAN